MNIAASIDPRIQSVRVTADEIIAHLADGRVISVPLAWSWRLSEATPAQRAKFRLIGSGQGVHWPEVDEDISVEGMLQGVPTHHAKNASALKDNPGALRCQVRPSRRSQRQKINFNLKTPIGSVDCGQKAGFHSSKTCLRAL